MSAPDFRDLFLLRKVKAYLECDEEERDSCKPEYRQQIIDDLNKRIGELEAEGG